jgi:hypothetical protein
MGREKGGERTHHSSPRTITVGSGKPHAEEVSYASNLNEYIYIIHHNTKIYSFTSV